MDYILIAVIVFIISYHRVTVGRLSARLKECQRTCHYLGSPEKIQKLCRITSEVLEKAGNEIDWLINMPWTSITLSGSSKGIREREALAERGRAKIRATVENLRTAQRNMGKEAKSDGS